MEDADSDSGFDSDGNRYHAGRDELYGLRTDSHAVGPTEKKREAPGGGDASLLGNHGVGSPDLTRPKMVHLMGFIKWVWGL